MPAPPARTEISDTYPNPSNATARIGFGRLYDYLVGLLGTSGNPAEARTALGVPSAANAALTGNPTATTQASTDNSTRIATTAWAKAGFAVSLGGTGYIKFPSWMGGLTLQWGTTVVTSNGAAQVTLSYPIAFANSVFTIVGFNGDNVAANTNRTAIYGTTSMNASAAAFVLIDTTTGNGIAGAAARLNWIAFGN